MKREKRNSTSWLLGGLAVMTFLGTGSIAAAQTVTSYNDLAWDTGQLDTNITKITSPTGGSGLPSTGNLVDFANGNPSAVSLTVTGGNYVLPDNGAHGADPTTGDAFTIFDGKVSGQGAVSYIASPGSDLVLTFTGMSPGKVYDLTYFAHRDNYAWDRASLVTLSGHDAFTNTSSVASDNPDIGNFPGGVLFTSPSSPTTRLPADNDNGYVARFSNVKAGPDGIVVLTISYDGSGGTHLDKGKYGSAIQLIESGSVANDLDGDGKSDIVVRNMNDGNVGAWLGNGLTLGATGIISNPGTEWNTVGNGDVDGDSKADIVLRHTNGDIAVWLGNGLTLGATGVLTTGLAAEWVIAGLGDLDGDGKDDIVVRNTNDGSVGAWLGNGLTLGATGVIANPGTDWDIAGLGDIDGDGKDDLVFRHTNGDIAVWLGNGLTLGATGVLTTGLAAEWVIAGLGDLDGDGKDDIVVRNTNDGSVGAWLGNGLTLGATGIIGGPGTDWNVVDVGDVDGDGKADLVFRHTVSGDAAVWLGNGLTIGSTGVIAAAVPLEWKIQP